MCTLPCFKILSENDWASRQQADAKLKLCECATSLQSCLTLCDPMDIIALQDPLSMGFSRQEY